MKDFSAFLDMRRYKNRAHKISSWEYITIKGPSCQLPGAQSASFLLSPPSSLRGCWRSAAAVAHDLILVEADGKHPWQVPICSWQYVLEKHLVFVAVILSGWALLTLLNYSWLWIWVAFEAENEGRWYHKWYSSLSKEIEQNFQIPSNSKFLVW